MDENMRQASPPRTAPSARTPRSGEFVVHHIPLTSSFTKYVPICPEKLLGEEAFVRVRNVNRVLAQLILGQRQVTRSLALG